MENASKALIIAGAILISILLISVGVMVMNSTGNMQGQVEDEMTQQAIQTFNAKFTAYEGEKKGSQVRSLMGIVDSLKGTSGGHTVTVKYNNTEVSNPGTLSSKVKSTATYTIEVKTDEQGYVNEIDITGTNPASLS